MKSLLVHFYMSYNIYGGGKEINNIQKYNINNGFVEGENNKIKVIKSLFYGIKKFDNLKKFI